MKGEEELVMLCRLVEMEGDRCRGKRLPAPLLFPFLRLSQSAVGIDSQLSDLFSLDPAHVFQFIQQTISDFCMSMSMTFSQLLLSLLRGRGF